MSLQANSGDVCISHIRCRFNELVYVDLAKSMDILPSVCRLQRFFYSNTDYEKLEETLLRKRHGTDD